MTYSNYTAEEDRLLLRLRADGMRWYEIAERLPGRSMQGCSQRHSNLIEAGAGLSATASFPVPEPRGRATADQMFGVGAADGSRRLLKAQLRTGQYFGEQRAAWLARHGAAA